MSVIIRNATKNDVSEMLEIINHEILNTKAVYHYDVKTYEEQEKWFEQKKLDQLPIFVATYKNEVVGYATYGPFRAFQGFQHSIEHSIYVKPTTQGLGIGNLLMKKLLEEAKNQNFHTMIACIDSNNEKSVLFHEKRGFTEKGRLKEVGFKFGEWLDLVMMQIHF